MLSHLKIFLGFLKSVMMKRIATSTKNVEQLPTQKEEGEDEEELVSESELRDEVQRDSQLYKQRKVKRRSILASTVSWF